MVNPLLAPVLGADGACAVVACSCSDEGYEEEDGDDDGDNGPYGRTTIQATIRRRSRPAAGGDYSPAS